VKKRILFLLEGFDKGGIEKVTLDIVNNLDPDKYDITVQTFWFGGHCQSQVNENVRVIPFFFRRYVRGIIRLIDYLSPRMLYRLFVRGKGKYDIEIAASDGGAAKVISGSTNKKAKKICWVHMDVVENGSKLKEFRSKESAQKIYNKFDRICCVSAPCLEQFKRKFGEFNDMRAVNNPLPINDIIRKAEGNVEYKKKDNVFRFVTVGRLGKEKGFDRLIDACKTLVDEGNNSFEVLIIGDGVEREALKQSVKDSGLEKTVYFLGFLTNPYPYIKNSDCYVCTSRNEAYPLTVGESLVLNTPVMGTECSGVSAWLEDNKYGIVVENSTDGITEGMRRVINMSEQEYLAFKNQAEQKALKLNFKRQMDFWEKEMLY